MSELYRIPLSEALTGYRPWQSEEPTDAGLHIDPQMSGQHIVTANVGGKSVDSRNPHSRYSIGKIIVTRVEHDHYTIQAVSIVGAPVMSLYVRPTYTHNLHAAVDLGIAALKMGH